jgi:hypothetical protein
VHSVAGSSKKCLRNQGLNPTADFYFGIGGKTNWSCDAKIIIAMFYGFGPVGHSNEKWLTGP